MILHFSLLDSYFKQLGYTDTKGCIRRLVNHGKLYKVKKGIYETSENVNPYNLTSYLLSPSYISFYSALSFYGMIEEQTKQSYTCACCHQNKRKVFNNVFGKFTYQDIPLEAFYIGIKQEKEIISKDNIKQIYKNLFDIKHTIDLQNVKFEYIYYIADKEKALLDTVYINKNINNIKQMYSFLFENIRLNIDIFLSLSKTKLEEYIRKYKQKRMHLVLQLYLKLKQEINNSD